LVAAAAIIVIFVLIWPRDPQPKYAGKKLSEWLLAIDSEEYDPDVGPQTKAAIAAVRHIGTNGIPHFLKWIEYRPPPWRTKLNNLLRRDDNMSSEIGWLGLSVLGPDAAPAIPTLNRLMNDPSDPMRSDLATVALGEIGEAGLAPLMAVLTNSTNRNRVQAAIQISVMG